MKFYFKLTVIIWLFANLAAASPKSNICSKGKIAVLAKQMPGYNLNSISNLVDNLKKQNFSVALLSADQVCNSTVLSTNNFFALIIPNAKVYPFAGYSALENFAKSGGHIVFAGGPAFKTPLWKINGKWQTFNDIIKNYDLKNSHLALDFNKPFNFYNWKRETSNFDKKTYLELIRDNTINNQKPLHFVFNDFDSWDGYITKKLDKSLYKNNDNLLSFLARGDARTLQISVDLHETDGSRWIATANISTNWQRVFLPVNSFKFWWAPDGTKRGGKNDKLNPKNVAKINFSMSQSHTPDSATSGKHEFFVADVRTLHDALISKIYEEKNKSLVLETIAPTYKVYPLSKVVNATNVAPWQTDYPSSVSKINIPKNSISPIPRTMGRGFNRKQKYRYISLIDALDAKGKKRGSLFWLLLNQNSKFKNACFIGLASEKLLDSPHVIKLLGQTLDRLHNGFMFIEAGADNFSVWLGEKVELGARILCFGQSTKNVDLKFEIKKQDGTVALNKKFKTNFKNGKVYTTNFISTAEKKEGEIFSVNVELIQNKKVIDKISHELAILDKGATNKEDFVQVNGNQFVLNGKIWEPAGMNYWPAYVAGMEIKDFFAGWLNRCFYEPEEVERDLTLMEKLGINMVSIQNFNLQTYPELLDFLRRCSTHKIKVNLFLTTSSPLNFKEKETRQYIENGKLAGNPALFAYDIIWEPGNYTFDKNNRPKWNEDWEKWIVEQYGNIVEAEKDWEYKAPRDKKGNVIAPPDKCFREDGNWRVMMAAYRRFMNNIMSRKWNRAYRILKKIDPNHLISFRQGNTLPHDFTLTATAKHIDFICPEGYAIANNDDGYDAACFITRFVHFTTGGKPIFWAEFGKHVWNRLTMKPDEKLIKKQNEYFIRFYKMALESGVNGLAPWWWPGGYRVDEHSDYGIIEPDRTLRPSARTLEKFAPIVKTPRDWPKADEFLEIDLDKHAGGYWYLCFNEGKDAYRAARQKGKMLGIRTRGTGTTSANTPLVAVGNRPYNGHNPLKYLDAEFNYFQILDANGNWTNVENGAVIEVAAGKPVRAKVSVGNIQEATWLPTGKMKNSYGAVVLASTKESDIKFSQPIKGEVPYLKDADFGEFTLCAPIEKRVKAEARMKVCGRCAFGEIRDFILKPRSLF